jgi:hypothetical protein
VLPAGPVLRLALLSRSASYRRRSSSWTYPRILSFLHLHLRLEDFDDVLGEAEAGPELNQDLPDRFGVVGDAEGRFEDLLDEVEVLGRDLHVQRLEGFVLRERGSSHILSRV